jgi:glycosyltransferase involved in cell wall biosynthesis
MNTNKLKILHIHEVYLPYKGGSAIRISKILESQKIKFDDTIHVLCSKSRQDNLLVHEVINGIDVFRQEKFRRRVFFKAFSLLIKNNYNVIHIHNSWLFLLVFPLIFFKKKIVLELHSFKKPIGLKGIFHVLAIKVSSHIIVLSKATKELLIKRNIKLSKNISTVINGVDVDKFLPIDKNEINNKTLVYAGSLYEWQGVKRVIELAMNFKNINDINFVIIGEGPLKSWILNKIKDNNLTNVRYVGFINQNDLVKELNKCSAALVLRTNLQQTNITFPLKILEYINLKIPIICTDREAHFEPLDNMFLKNEFFTIVSDNIDLMANEIIYAINNINIINQKADELHGHISNKNFTWLNSSVENRKVYEKN